jgi:ABC-type phosphate transport system substrate-binding protein
VNGTASTIDLLGPDLVRDTIRLSKGGGGGSGTACGPVADSTPQTFLVTTSMGCDAGVLNGDVTEYKNCTMTEDRVADGGNADVECSLLGASAAQLSNLSQSAGWQIIFGSPVPTKLYRALQRCQGLPENDDAVNAPSLTRNILNALYTGRIARWGDLECDADGDGTIDGDVASYYQAIHGTALAFGGAVSVQRRVESSGTQTFTEIWMGNNPDCNATTVNGFRSEGTCGGNGRDCDTLIGNGDGSALTCCNRGSGDVRAAIQACNTNNWGCIGVLSLDSYDTLLGQNDDNDDYGRFLKINGYAPTACNAINGGYHFVSLNSSVTRIGVTNPLLPLFADAGSAVSIAQVNTNEVDTQIAVTGFGGNFLSDPANPAATPTDEVCLAGAGGSRDPLINPTSNFTKTPTGSPNNCQENYPGSATEQFILQRQSPGGAGLNPAGPVRSSLRR